MTAMTHHLQIIEREGGYQAIAEKLGLPAERVRFWKRRQSIPHDQWGAVAKAGVATLDELAGLAKPSDSRAA
jgi:hypothetical protein